ncbi:MAG: hypothetical protein WAM97_22165 [Acidimicrobiales bacterium]
MTTVTTKVPTTTTTVPKPPPSTTTTLAPLIELSPTNYTFEVIHEPSASEQFVVTNDVGSVLVVGLPSVSITASEQSAGDGDPFSITADTCSGAALSPGQSCDVTVTAGPVTSYGPDGTLTVPSNAGTATADLIAIIT